MREAYAFFAHYYDRFMEEAPYEAWLEWILETIQPLTRHAGERLRVLDLGCGTGNLAIPLVMNGHEVVATDVSEPMVNVARSKSNQLRSDEQKRLTFLVQDMSQPSTFEHTFHAVICCCDSLNYVTDPTQVKRVFQQVRSVLEPGGLFLFDVHTPTQLQSYMQEQPYIWNDPDVAYIWTCEMEQADCIRHDLVLFAQTKEGTYERIEELHRQRTYSKEWLTGALQEARLEVVHVTADFSPFPITVESRRAFYVAVAV
jgi:SAM-dependent methyltransferase